jgi:N-formylglutamate amidohydrolase
MGLFNGRQSTLPHPSNRLYHGECIGFDDASKTYLAAMRYERDMFTDDDEFNRESKALCDKSIATAETLRAEYQRTVGKAERELAEAWAKSADETTAMFGKAVLDGDFSPLAV